MTPQQPRNIAFVCRWGVVSMGNSGLEGRLRALLEPKAAPITTNRHALMLTVAAATAITVSVSGFHLRQASARALLAATPKVASAVSHWVVPNGDDATLPEGVTVHAIGASDVSATVRSGARPSDQIWWHPDGTLYSSPPRIGDLHHVTDVMSNRAHGQRRLRFAVQIDNLPKGQQTGFGPIPDGRFADDTIVTTSTIPGGLVWLMYYSVPKDVREESMSVMVSHGPWKETLRRRLTWTQLSHLPTWEDLLSHVPSPSPSEPPPHAYVAPRIYPIASTQPGTSEFAVRLARRDVTDGNGNDWRFFLLDRDGHRLVSSGRANAWGNSDFLVKFSTDESAARRAAFVGVESRPWSDVTFKHLAVWPKGKIR